MSELQRNTPRQLLDGQKIDEWLSHFRRHYAATPDCDLEVFRTICKYAKTYVQSQRSQKEAA